MTVGALVGGVLLVRWLSGRSRALVEAAVARRDQAVGSPARPGLG